MTRKDYVAIAQALHECKPLMATYDQRYADQRETWDECVVAIADVLAADNARFERLRFVGACSKGI